MDYFNTGNSLENSKPFLEELFFQLYDFKPTNLKNTFFGLNLKWPKFELPLNYGQYFLSFHTEYIDFDWAITQAHRVYPCKVILVADYNIEPWPNWPDNIETVTWISLHKQIQLLKDRLGSVKEITLPKFKVSSLSFRVSQYKKFVTSYLLKNFDHSDIILTYHNQLFKSQDLHGHPVGFKHLEDLNFDIGKTFINFDDDFKGNTPVENGNWLNPAYTDSLINLTNESFHYSQTVSQDILCRWPGPYLTEKTFKPLLAGRPFLVVGQYQSYKWLKNIGFDTDFGFDISYDQDPGDLTRIGALFKTLDFINQQSIFDLYESSLKSVKHNLNWIDSGNFYECCQQLNLNNKHKLQDL